MLTMWNKNTLRVCVRVCVREKEREIPLRYYVHLLDPYCVSFTIKRERSRIRSVICYR